MDAVRYTLLVFIISACGGRQVMAPKWRDTAPAAPCEVLETYTDAMGASPLISKYTSEGRLLFAQTRLTYDGHGFEHVTWKNDRVVRIDSYYENAFREGSCDVEGGCDKPAFRTVETSLYHYDSAGRWSGLDHELVEYRQRENNWVEHRDDARELRYVFQGDRLVAIEGGERGDVELGWKNGHPATRRFDGRTSTYEWKNDRLVMYHWFDYAQSFEYDVAGRLVREELASKSGDPTITEWTYDAAGRLISESHTTRNETRQTVWTYDAEGRITSTAQDGRVNRTFTYRGSCPANLRVMRAPTAELRSNIGQCIRSPGNGYDNCFYAQR